MTSAPRLSERSFAQFKFRTTSFTKPRGWRDGTTGQFKLTLQDVKSILIGSHLVAIEKYVAAETAKRTGAAGEPEV